MKRLHRFEVWPRCIDDLYRVAAARSDIEQVWRQGDRLLIEYHGPAEREKALRRWLAIIDKELCRMQGRKRRERLIDLVAWAFVICVVLCILGLIKR